MKPRIVHMLGAALCASPLPAPAQPVSDASLNAVGGAFSVKCQDSSALRLTVQHNRLILSSKGKMVVSGEIQENRELFGRSPPSGFQTAILGKVAPSGNVKAVFYRAGRDVSVELVADQSVLNQLSSQPIPAVRMPKC